MKPKRTQRATADKPPVPPEILALARIIARMNAADAVAEAEAERAKVPPAA